MGQGIVTPVCPTCGQPVAAELEPGAPASPRPRPDRSPRCATCEDTGVVKVPGGFAFCTECRRQRQPLGSPGPSAGAVESAAGLGQNLAATPLDRAGAVEAIAAQFAGPLLRRAALDSFDRERGSSTGSGTVGS